MFLRMTSRLLVANIPVIACGYSASAEPSASVAYAHSPADGVISEPNGLEVAGLVLASWVDAAPKMWLQPPSLVGM
jgi:hypothetical protein